MRRVSLFTTHRFIIPFTQFKEPIYLYPIGDIHRESALCSREKFLEWCQDKKDRIKKGEKMYFIGMGDYCFTLDTQALTKEGWKSYHQLSEGELVYGYDIKDDKLKWTRLNKVYLSSQYVYEMKSKSFLFKCTENHGWIVSQQNWSNRLNGERKTKSGWLPKKKPLKELKSQHRIKIVSDAYGYKKEMNITPLETELIGWIVTDGHQRKNMQYACSLYQSDKKHLKYLKNKFKDYITNTYIREDYGTINLKRSKIKELFDRIGFKNKESLPLIIPKLGTENQRVMFNAFVMAEGWKQNGSWCFSQKEGSVLEAFELLCAFLGIRIGKKIINKKTGVVTYKTSNRKNTTFFDIKIKKLGKEEVWCPVTDLGTVVVKQGNQITITGNSDFASVSEQVALTNPSIHDQTIEDTFERIATEHCDKLLKEMSFMNKQNTIGLMEGNHYWTLKGGITTTQYMCRQIGCDYLGLSTVIRLSFFKINNNSDNMSIVIFAHHGRGGGRALGASVNNVSDMQKIFPEADIFLMGDDHKKWGYTISRLTLGKALDVHKRPIVLNKKTILGRTGGFLRGYVPGKQSYVAQKALPPTDIGTIEITMIPKIESHREGGHQYRDRLVYLDVKS